jgi:hypothetical protein
VHRSSDDCFEFSIQRSPRCSKRTEQLFDSQPFTRLWRISWIACAINASAVPTASLGQGTVLFQAVRGMQPQVYERFITDSCSKKPLARHRPVKWLPAEKGVRNREGETRC